MHLLTLGCLAVLLAAALAGLRLVALRAVADTYSWQQETSKTGNDPVDVALQRAADEHASTERSRALVHLRGLAARRVRLTSVQASQPVRLGFVGGTTVTVEALPDPALSDLTAAVAVGAQVVLLDAVAVDGVSRAAVSLTFRTPNGTHSVQVDQLCVL